MARTETNQTEILPSGVYSPERGAKQMLVELDEKMVSAWEMDREIQ